MRQCNVAQCILCNTGNMYKTRMVIMEQRIVSRTVLVRASKACDGLSAGDGLGQLWCCHVVASDGRQSVKKAVEECFTTYLDCLLLKIKKAHIAYFSLYIFSFIT